MRVLSIDWDYFVEENPLLDMAHRESDVFLEFMWATRRLHFEINSKGNLVASTQDLTKLMPFVGDELVFSRLPFFGKWYNLLVAESHSSIVQSLVGFSDIELINVDAHHDVFYRELPLELSVNEETNIVPMDCSNWVAYLAKCARLSSVVQIYPEWRKKFPEKYSHAARWLRKKGVKYTVFVGSSLARIIRWKRIDVVFICRSGCWTPPEYDMRFNRFCRMFGCLTPMKIRSTKSEIISCGSKVSIKCV